MSRKAKKNPSAVPMDPVPTAFRAPDLADAGQRRRRWALYGLYVFMLAWPLGAFQRLVGPVHLHHLALVPVFALTIEDWIRNKRIRTPFELVWPCVLIAALTLLFRVTRIAAPPWALIGLCLLFIAVYHVIPSRRTIMHLLQCAMAGACAMVLLSVAARLNWLFPTTFILGSPLVMAGPYSVPGGLFAALVCVLPVPALWMAKRRGEYAPGLLDILVCMALPIGLLLFLCIPSRPGLEILQPSYSSFVFPSVLIALVVLWGLARVCAKLLVAARVEGRVAHGAFVAALFLALVAALLLNPPAAAGPVGLLALMAAYARPGLSSGPCPAPLRWFIPAVALLVAINVMVLSPGDPRNYERFARQALARGEYASLRAHLEFVKARAPLETRADYYIARAYLNENNHGAATAAFQRAMRPVSPRLLPGPSDEAIALFLDDMRDRTSALPETLRGLSYEQSLIAAGRERHALSLLELRGDAAPKMEISSAPLARALAAALGAPHLAESLLLWEAGLMAHILASAGPFNAIREAPPGFPETQLPLVAMARQGPGELVILVFTPAGHFGGVLAGNSKAPRIMDIAQLLDAAGWHEWRHGAAGVWRLAFGSNAEVQVRNTPEVVFRPHGTPPEEAPWQGWETLVFLTGEDNAHEE